SFEEAIALVNDSSYGLSASIYTQDVNRVFAAIRDFEVGMIYINGPTIATEAHLPFGGMKHSGNGDREGGTAVLDVFSELKTVYVDFSGRLQLPNI
ncbi:MAG: aldehyde dehydrogenase family protein, partial [Nostocales cyanobacterium W4_Combined_metabat2_030]|nr:aldehyde dehydrogenase family protein [Nostocales cyanobacterium W4_Combined_metabat2_030]